ncbi:putative odorant-binding protein A5 [Planococcus citri]|uniref:putative odorant-binding protein A5 n=1 Tax=Planococcus citri TaxID=170843 RepID=UPI0031F921D4
MLFGIFCISATLHVCNAIHVVGRPTIKPKTDSEYDEERSMFYHEFDFEEKAVVPHFLPKTPPKRCRMIWEKCEARNGNIVDQSLLTEAPDVVWNGEHGALYTLVLFHTHLYLKMHQDWLPWVVGNIPGPNLYRLGDRLWPYKLHYLKGNPFIHKHIIVIYEQKGFIHFDKEDRYSRAKSHADFNLTEFTSKYDLGMAKFSNFIFSNNFEWDNPEKRFYNAYLDTRDSHAVPTLYGINMEKI